MASPALFVGSFPPRQCGIATFTRDLVTSYDLYAGSVSDVIAIDRAGDAYGYEPRVIGRIVQGERASYDAAAVRINAHPSAVVNIQHEYGLFGGENGAFAGDLVAAIRKPVVLTLHTVLPNPDARHAAATRTLAAHAARVIVLSETARALLVSRYGIASRSIDVIHHGAPDVPFEETSRAKHRLGLGERPVVATLGLMSKDKGLEYAIAAIHELTLSHPDVLYLVVGATHPNVLRMEGDSYRERLRERVAALALENNVRMVDRYLSLGELLDHLAASDVYLTPYVNPDQVVSGTLAYALAAGKAIVSTPYLYARELLDCGRGALAEFRDSHSIARALAQLLDDHGLRERTQRSAYAFGRRMIWSSISVEYAQLFARLRSLEMTRVCAS